MFKEVMEHDLINFLEPRHNKEVERTRDPKYIFYHRLISVPLKIASNEG